MKHCIRLLAWTVSLAALCAFAYYLLPPSESGRQAVERLAKVQVFSLGPTSYAGLISQREDDFFTVLASRHSARLFRDLYERGTPEAKFYALCGLRLSHAGHEQYTTRFTREVAKFSALGGCVESKVTSSEALSALRQGLVETYLPVRREIERARTKQASILKPSG